MLVWYDFEMTIVSLNGEFELKWPFESYEGYKLSYNSSKLIDNYDHEENKSHWSVGCLLKWRKLILEKVEIKIWSQK